MFRVKEGLFNDMTILYKSGDTVTTKIDVDYITNTVEIENYTDDIINRAFGINEHPTFEDYERFLESRCFPRTRDNMKIHLQELGIDRYDPLLICKKTNGRLEGDINSLEFVK